MDPNFAQLQATIANATGAGTGAGAPILGGYPELEKFYNSTFQAPFSDAASSALSTNTDINVANAKRAASAGGRGKPQRVRKEDGGFAFFDENGNEISAKQFAELTGNTTTDILSDSENPIDIQYLNDYKNLQDFMNAATTGDRDTLDAYYQQNNNLRSLSPADVIKQFRQAYPTVYGTRNTGQPLGSTFIPRVGNGALGSGPIGD